MNSDISSNLSLKYHRLTTSGCKDIGIGKFKFVTRTHFLLWKYCFQCDNELVCRLAKGFRKNPFISFICLRVQVLVFSSTVHTVHH